MATAMGQRIIDRYKAGEATIEHLDAALARTWINQDEYNNAYEFVNPPTTPTP